MVYLKFSAFILKTGVTKVLNLMQNGETIIRMRAVESIRGPTRIDDQWNSLLLEM